MIATESPARPAIDARRARRRVRGRREVGRWIARNIATSSVSDGLFDVETLHDVAGHAHEQQRERQRPRVPLTAAHAAREEQQTDARERDEHRRGFGNLDRREPAERAEAARQRQRRPPTRG